MLASNLVYQIDGVLDRDGNKKEIPSEWLSQRYSLDIVVEGRSAFLGWVGGSGKGLQTSTVKQVFIHENTVVITTRNTVYYMKPIIEME